MHTEVTHPLVQHKLTLLRDTATGGKLFRELASEITMFLTYEALKDLETEPCTVQTPLAIARCRRLKNDIVLVPILRAGVGMIDGVTAMVPNVRVGFVGVYRDHETTLPVRYYANIPDPLPGSVAVVIDPMLATAGTAGEVVDLLKRRGFTRILFVCIVSCPEGLAAMAYRHPDVAVYTAACDDGLDPRKYILPGLGDAGDRLFGTR
jgi:uracil phosphoribosyltransferase